MMHFFPPLVCLSRMLQNGELLAPQSPPPSPDSSNPGTEEPREHFLSSFSTLPNRRKGTAATGQGSCFGASTSRDALMPILVNVGLERASNSAQLNSWVSNSRWAFRIVDKVLGVRRS